MRRSTLLMCALLTIATSGCKQINEQVQKIKDKIAPAAPAAPAPATPQPAPTMDRPLPRDQEPPVPSRPVASADVPYTSADTGTIAPGMGEKEIYSLWGPPADVRHQGQYTYIFYPNGSEHTCGTADVVILQNGQVVD